MECEGERYCGRKCEGERYCGRSVRARGTVDGM